MCVTQYVIEYIMTKYHCILLKNILCYQKATYQNCYQITSPMNVQIIVKLGQSQQRRPSSYYRVLNPQQALQQEKINLGFPRGKGCCSYQGFYISPIDLMLCAALTKATKLALTEFPLLLQLAGGCQALFANHLCPNSRL